MGEANVVEIAGERPSSPAADDATTTLNYARIMRK